MGATKADKDLAHDVESMDKSRNKMLSTTLFPPTLRLHFYSRIVSWSNRAQKKVEARKLQLGSQEAGRTKSTSGS